MHEERMKFAGVKDKRIWLFLIPFSVLLLLFVSNDSYLYDMYGKNDSTIFFMSGKAWMNGMVPYIDFSDSKGPLLWLIYGIGYLLSHYNYIGVFWVSCLFYVFIFYYVFKTANLFLSDDRLSLLATVLMSLSFFDPLIHNDIRAEDFSQLFIVMSLYWSCKVLYALPDELKTRNRCAYVIGLCTAACLMIKFTLAAMIFIFGIYVLIATVRTTKELGLFVWFVLLGFASIILPFVVVFLVEGNLYAFVYEYFVRTFITVNHTNDTVGYLDRMFSYFTSRSPFVIFSISVIATLLFARTAQRHRFFPMICFLWFYVLTIQNGIWNHYYVSCAVFLLFGIIPIIQIMKQKNVTIKYHLAIIIVFLICSSVNVVRNILFTKSFFLCDTEQRTIYYEYASIMSQVPKPKILSLGLELGYGAPVGTLPGCRYWTKQTGATQDMIDNQWDAILMKSVDFVLVNYQDSVSVDKLLAIGYYPNYIKNSILVVYSKEKIKHREIKNVLPKDILLKRNLYGL